MKKVIKFVMLMIMVGGMGCAKERDIRVFLKEANESFCHQQTFVARDYSQR